ncbi:MAG: M14 family zinc carboxypeptidase [Bacteriovoracia bacterium]
MKRRLPGAALAVAMLVSLTGSAMIGADEDLKKWCQELNPELKKFKWKLDACQFKDMRVGGRSVKGRPLVFREFGDPNAKNTTLVFSMVHGDETTPLFLGLRLMDWLEANTSKYPGTRIVIAPLVNPDGFYRHPRTRTNANKVDVNRNFNTADWAKDATRMWKKKYRADPRYFPGKQAESEPETQFQAKLISEYKPNKIISVHSPLNFMDYDGPDVLALAKFPSEYVTKCLQLRQHVNAHSGGFYPGSLGNYTGQERGIPTLTLELPSTNPQRAEEYWNHFLSGIETVIQFRVPDPQVKTPDPVAGRS